MRLHSETLAIVLPIFGLPYCKVGSVEITGCMDVISVCRILEIPSNLSTQSRGKQRTFQQAQFYIYLHRSIFGLWLAFIQNDRSKPAKCTHLEMLSIETDMFAG